MLAGTAAAVRLTLNERRLAPVTVAAAPPLQPAASFAAAAGAARGALSLPRTRAAINRVVLAASGLTVLALAIVAAMPAVGAFAMDALTSESAPAAQYAQPAAGERAAASLAGNWEGSVAASRPPAGDVGAALMAGAEERYLADVSNALRFLAAFKEIDAQRAAAAAAARPSVAARPNAPSTLNRPSGYAAGTIVRARITIYGCTGPGGGFCGGTASGVKVFEGAAACSRDLPFGTKLRIQGDPTGRVYECVDRGALAPTWVDVFFYDTRAGMAWQSSLGSTIANIEIVN